MVEITLDITVTNWERYFINVCLEQIEYMGTHLIFSSKMYELSEKFFKHEIFMLFGGKYL
jgi:hypothetical protein